MKTWKGLFIYFLVVILVQPSAMYLLLRVWHWRIFVSTPLAAALAFSLAYYVGRWVDRRPTA